MDDAVRSDANQRSSLLDKIMLRSRGVLKRTGRERQVRMLFVAVASVGLLFASRAPVASQNQQQVYKPGDTVEDGSGYVYKILRCDGQGEWDECEYQAYLDGKPTGSSTGRMTIRNLRAAEQRVREAKKREARSSGESEATSNNPAKGSSPALSNTTTVTPAPRQRNQTTHGGPAAGPDGKWTVGDKLEVNDRAFWYPAQITAIQGGRYRVHFEGYPSSDDKWVDVSRMRPVGGYKVEAECNYEPPGPSVSGQSNFSEALAKRKIFDEYNWKANGTLSAPLKVGVAFLSFQSGEQYKNSVANVPGYGAQRRHGGAPAGATIYSFKSKRLVCEQHRDGVTRRLVEGSSACFVDKDGSWTCPSENDTKITQLDQD